MVCVMCNVWAVLQFMADVLCMEVGVLTVPTRTLLSLRACLFTLGTPYSTCREKCAIGGQRKPTRPSCRFPSHERPACESCRSCFWRVSLIARGPDTLCPTGLDGVLLACLVLLLFIYFSASWMPARLVSVLA